MIERTDMKGKSFSELISKDKVKVSIWTQAGYLVGYLHIEPTRRLKDALNTGENFIALTDGVVDLPGGQGSRPFDFLALNKDQIVYLVEEEKKHAISEQGASL